MIDTTTCVVCGRIYNTQSKPQWAADERGVIVGTAHAGCAKWSWEGAIRRAHGADIPLDAARFTAWNNATYPPRSAGHHLLAAVLIGEEPPQDTPSQRQRDLMAHWSSPGNTIGAAGAEAAWARYTALVAEYRAWRANDA